MARRVLIECDVCRKEAREPIRIDPKVGSQTGVEGTEEACAEIDLCPECAGRIFRKYLAKMTPTDGRLWVAENIPHFPLPPKP